MIGKIERGTAGASFKTVEKMCKLFRVQPNELFPATGIQNTEREGLRGDIFVLLSKLDDSELSWVKNLLKEAINYPR